MNEKMNLYSVDTSAFLFGIVENYPIDHFPALWEKIDDLVSEGRFFIIEEVWEELKYHHPLAKEWCESRLDRMMIKTDKKIIEKTKELLSKHSRIMGVGKTRNAADPFVISLAQTKEAFVVTEEVGGTTNSPKIPSICIDLEVPYCGFLDIIRYESWIF